VASPADQSDIVGARHRGHAAPPSVQMNSRRWILIAM